MTSSVIDPVNVKVKSNARGLVRSVAGTAAAEMMASLQALRRRIVDRTGVIVFAPPSPQRNRGDEALLRSLLAGLEERGCETTVFATGQKSLELLSDFPQVTAVPESYPAFSSQQASKDVVRLLPRVAAAQEIVLVGADVIDEGYGISRSYSTLDVLRLCQRVGIPLRIVSFSINELPSSKLGRKFRTLAKSCRLFCRDPASIRRLRAAGVSNIVESGDLAYLLKPAPESDVPAADQNFITRAPGPVIGLNIISKVLGKDGRFNERMQLIANACKELAESDKCRFLLLPHDDHEDSADLARLAQALLEIGGESWSHLVTPVPRAALAKRLAGMCTHLFTCRLHLGIAALGMGRPITGFPYQGKFEGQFELFGLSEEGLISPDRFPTSVDELVALMRARIAQSDALAKQIQSRLPAVQALSRKNFDGLGSVPESAP